MRQFAVFIEFRLIMFGYTLLLKGFFAANELLILSTVLVIFGYAFIFMGSIWFLMDAFQVHFLWGILSLFLIPVAIVFWVSHLRLTLVGVQIIGIGVLFYLSGIAIYMLSHFLVLLK